MVQVLKVIPHPTGPWLVKAGKTAYAVPPLLGRALRPLAGRSPDGREVRACLARGGFGSTGEYSERDLDFLVGELILALESGGVGSRGRTTFNPGGRAIRLRVPLVPSSLVARLARALQGLAGKRGLAVLALLGMTGYLAGTVGPGMVRFSWDLGTVAAGFGLFLLTAFWHELGHAAALARSGYPPGGIGGGVLFVIPVLFADVTPIGALNRASRIRVDIAGVVFQLAAGGVLMALASWPGCPGEMAQVLTLGGSSALLAISWSLFPFIRSDGYWILSDCLGLEDLDRPPAVLETPGLRAFLVAFQLANALFLLGVGIYVPWRMIGLVVGWAHNLGFSPAPLPPIVLAGVAALTFLGLMGIGLARRVLALVRSASTVARGHG